MQSDQLKDRESRIKIDEQLIDKLLSHGAVLENRYLIDFLFVGNEASLNKLEPDLIGQGYKKNAKGSTNTRLLVQKTMKLDLLKSHIVLESLESLADEFGVKFDGWGTAV